MRIRLALLVLLLALGVAAAAVAKPSFSTKVSIHYDFDEMEAELVWDGKVRSDKQGCVTNRRVILRNENSDEPLGNDRAEETGEYEIRLGADGLGGRYYTKVHRLERSGYDCKGDQSKRIEPG